MKNFKIRKQKFALLLAAILLLCGIHVAAENLSGDNSLYSLGITTEGATVSPEFYYSTIEYEVTVPAGTTSLSLDPVTSNSAAVIDSINGTELTDGATTVSITVTAENGSSCTYYLYVTEDSASAQVPDVVAETEPETEPQTEPETEEETEDPRYVTVAKDTLQEAENTINTLKSEASEYRDRVDLLLKILYGMIALCVILLFVVINLLLKKKDLKAELSNYQGMGLPGGGRQGYPEQEIADKKPGKTRRRDKKSKEYGADGDGQAVYVTDDRYGQDGRSVYEEDAYSQPGNLQGKGSSQASDDPAMVPKPAKAKKPAKKMPEYEPPKEPPKYTPPQNPKESASDDMTVHMIDL